MKIVINRCYGGFGLSDAAISLYLQKKKIKFCTESSSYGTKFFTEDNIEISRYTSERDDSLLIEIIEQLGEEASGPYSKLKVVEIPDDVEWEIDNYDGIESIHEVHRVWK